MSSPKFASITASLLARKGEAAPWSHTSHHHGIHPEVHVHAEHHADMQLGPVGTPRLGLVDAEKMSHHWRAPACETAEPPPPPPPSKEKSCMMRMSAHDFERLGILAIKTGSSRAQLLKDALSEFLANRADEYGCSCLGACENGCGDVG